MDPIIKIENLSKQYRLGNVGTGTLSHDLNRWWANVRGKEDPFLKIGEANTQNTKGSSDYVWALKDINLEVMPGEVLGIIGKNGAGKSTLLKLLSRVTAPTTGCIKARGRIASLLEVGTGFHPELTGRENIFLNGAILGMTKAEIRGRFDEIVNFAGVERYIDTPVKRYSSGMYVRLAFAVAAHLEPEILVVDEVLAVGDAEFQKKAIGKMQDVSKNDGRTVLFVSHNMAAIKSLCGNIIVLENGGVLFLSDNVDRGIDRYLNEQKSSSISSSDFQKYEDDIIKLLDFRIVDSTGESLTGAIPRLIKAFVEIDFYLKVIDPALNVGYGLYGSNEECYLSTWMKDGHLNDWPKLKLGKNTLIVDIPLSFINEGSYKIQLFVGMHNQKWIVSPIDNVALYIDTKGTLIDSPYWYQKRDALCAPLLNWQKKY